MQNLRKNTHTHTHTRASTHRQRHSGTPTHISHFAHEHICNTNATSDVFPPEFISTLSVIPYNVSLCAAHAITLPGHMQDLQHICGGTGNSLSREAMHKVP